ncbi:MAG: MarR family winged helix-turn-helix transcriptional regulator [Brachybacterium sp.]|uniref:MarR family winged helix-turn-helix transcriptional regulator n=1 Tax=unclassified Brachybacterium TaxID=2623841 RepID=UPI003F933C49
MSPGIGEADARDPQRPLAEGVEASGRVDAAEATQVAELAAELQRVLLVSSRILRSHTASDAVSAPQFSVLAYLQRAGESTPGALADFEHVSPPVMTRILGRLEEAGLVERAAHPGDGRQVRVTLTEEGLQVVLAGREQRDAWLRARLGEATPAQRDGLRDASTLLRQILIPPRH